jgi:undecaprenyl-diphosphatase
MDVLQAIALGVLEGFTEFLPISSTGHLIVAQDLIGFRDSAKIFTVVIQLGAIFAIVWNYRRDLLAKVAGLFRGDKKTINFWIVWMLATVPGGAAGFLLKDKVSVYAVTVTVAIALILGGILIWLIETYHKAAPNKTGKAQLDKITKKQALAVGCYQALALIPGVSRSGSTIMGGLLSGFDRVTAAAFSFYISIPILVLAGAYQLFGNANDFSTVQGGASAIVAGTLAAFVTALLTIRWLLSYVSRHSFKLFAYYRIILGSIILVVLSFS